MITPCLFLEMILYFFLNTGKIIRKRLKEKNNLNNISNTVKLSRFLPQGKNTEIVNICLDVICVIYPYWDILDELMNCEVTACLSINE